MRSNVIAILEVEEGFNGDMYFDTEGFATIGFGTKLPLDMEEGRLLLAHRLDKLIKEVDKSLEYLDIEDEAWDILYLMAYQIGVGGLLKFKNMLLALENKDYVMASQEMLDSKWAKQTPARARRMADMMRRIS